MKKLVVLVLVVVLLVLVAAVTSAESPIVHSVHVGGPDICPGCDKSFSLTAIEYADGTVKGQWVDKWGLGGEGHKSEIDCLEVDTWYYPPLDQTYTAAWVSGTVKNGSGSFLPGTPVSTWVLDTNGLLEHDAIGGTHWPDFHHYQCDAKMDFYKNEFWGLSILEQGVVIIK